MKYRLLLGCGHKSEIREGDPESEPNLIACEKCAGDVTVIGHRPVKDTAKLPTRVAALRAQLPKRDAR